MTIILDTSSAGLSSGQSDDEDYGDVCSILVPVDLVNTNNAIVSITSNGMELPEDINPAWSSTVTYAVGNRVYVAHTVYESLKDSNTNHDPSILANQTTAAGVGTWWLKVGPTNRTAMFDGLISSQTLAPGPLVITISPGAFNGFAVFGLDADSYAVSVVSAPGGNVIYTEPTTALDSSHPGDYYEYFFDRFKPLRQFVKSGIDPYGSSQVTLTFNKGSGNVGIGMLAIGDLKPVGIPQRDAEVTPNDFSYFSQDAYGVATIKKRANSTGMTITTMMGEDEAGIVLDAIKEVLGVPVVVVGSQATLYEWMTVFGLVSGSMNITQYPYASLKLTVKGFI